MEIVNKRNEIHATNIQDFFLRISKLVVKEKFQQQQNDFFTAFIENSLHSGISSMSVEQLISSLRASASNYD